MPPPSEKRFSAPDFSASSILTRRSFLQNSAILAGGMTLLPLFPQQAFADPAPADDSGLWYHKPLRIMHTVLRETDATTYDAQVVVDYLTKTGCNALCVNAGGIVDFFQNPLPAGNVNRFMGSRDILREITTACHTAGLKVIGRIDFRGSEEHVFQKFPDWYSRDADQKPILLTYTKPQLYMSCYTGQHRNAYLNEFVRYVMKNYNLDGIWHNSPGHQGICYCSDCQTSYFSAAGVALPLLPSASEAEVNQYMAWKREAADQHMARIKKTVKSFGPDKAYTAEVFSIYGVGQKLDWGIDLKNARDHFDILVSVAFLTENTEHVEYEDLNYGSTIIKFLKSMAPEREAAVMYGGNGTSHRLVIEPPLDLNIWLWQILSAGGRFWNCYFTNVPTVTHDRRNAFNESVPYNFVKTHEKLLDQQVPVANVGIYYSDPTRLSYQDKRVEGDTFGLEIRGVEAVLMENHIPHDFILNDQLSQERLQKYRLVILPNVRCMSTGEMELLKDFVREGGNLLATYTTSLYDLEGRERPELGLAELFGVTYAGIRENTRKDNYQFIQSKNHPIVAADSPHTELLFNAGFTLLTKPVAGADVICTLVPTVHNQPPDKAWVEQLSSEFPTIVQNTYGKGRVLYFANQPDVLSYEPGHPDPRHLLERSIRHLAGNALPVQETTAPASVHIGLTESRQKPGQYILSFVNTTSGPKRPIRELIPVHDIRVRLRLDGKSLGKHQVLRAQGDCRVRSKGQEIEIQLTKLEDFCAVYLQMKA